MVRGGGREKINVSLNGKKIEQVESFKFSVSIVTKDIRSTREIKARKGKGSI